MKLSLRLSACALFIVLALGLSSEATTVAYVQAQIQSAPNVSNLPARIHIDWACAFSTSITSQEISISLASPDVNAAIQSIVRHVGLPANFVTYSSPNIENAAAAIVGGRRVILYNPNFIATARKGSQSNWSAISILAHEVAHHLAGHTLDKSTPPLDNELVADRFSGFVLSGMGATLDETELAVKLLTSPVSSGSHPSRSRRVSSVEDGWMDASRLRATGALPPPPPDDEQLQGIQFNVFDLLGQSPNEPFPLGVGGKVLLPRELRGTIHEQAIQFFSALKDGSCARKGPVVAYVYSSDKNEDPFIKGYTLQFESGERVGMELNARQASRAIRSWLEPGMVPGRRVRITYSVCGNGGFHHIQTLEFLPAIKR